MVHARLRRADRRAGAGLAGDRHRRAHADLRARPARARRSPRSCGGSTGSSPSRREDAHPARLRLAAEGALLRRREEPARAAARDRRRRARRRPHRRHAAEGPAGHAPPPAGHPHHHARVAVPDAHQPGARDLRARRGGDRRRDPRRRADQARRAPRDHARAAASRRPTAPVQRIGLSATQNPLEEVGRFMVGPKRTCTDRRHRRAQAAGPEDPRAGRVDGRARAVRDARARPVRRRRGDPQVDLAGDLPARSSSSSSEHRSTIVFVNNRRGAERLALRLNELAPSEDGPPSSRRATTARWRARSGS